jgi:hypothetical protein
MKGQDSLIYNKRKNDKRRETMKNRRRGREVGLLT